MADSTQDPFMGLQIDEFYIDKRLGNGNMARVYRGYIAETQRHVAIKVIEPDVRADPEYTKRFQKEARAIAQLEHPHIVQFYRYGEFGDVCYMAMEYIDGMDLAWLLQDYRAEHKFMRNSDILRIISQIGSALDYAHSQGIIHRDVKPSNVMLNRNGDAILTDFGLALLQAEGTRGEIFGTPYYIAPEQAINSAGAVPQSDLYSLGVALYEMLTGAVPFDMGSPMDTAIAHMSELPPSPLERNPDLNPAFVPVLERVLLKDPLDRYQSGAEFARALHKAVKMADN
jgi:serine/threonine protein kinase